MLSIRALGNLSAGGTSARAVAHYYSERTSDYYVGEGNQQQIGAWMGEGVAQLDLPAYVEREQFQLALAGCISGKHVQNAGRTNRQMGWDLTYSAPKSVSITWAFSDLEHRRQIDSAHQKAVKEACLYLESKITTRRGSLGIKREKTRVVVAHFTHHVSRAGDPQLHSHVVVPNFSIRSDGTVGTIESRVLYEHKMAAGALYQVELAWKMRQLGYRIELGQKGTFRLLDMNSRLEELFSKRDRQIDKIVKERGIRDYVGTRKVVLESRPAKVVTTLSERESLWRSEIKEADINIGIRQFNRQVLANGEFSFDEIVNLAGKQVTESKSVFREKDMIRELAKLSLGQRNAKEIQTMFRSAERDGKILNIGNDRLQGKIYTTREMIDIEREMIDNVQILVRKKRYAVDSFSAVQKRPFFSDEQKMSIKVATGQSGISVIQGRAGTGKTMMLSVVREAYENAGWQVQGIALSGQAAQNLQEEAGILSKTIASWRNDGELSNNTVIIVDEAGMVGSRQMKEILERSRLSGAKVVLVGDERQLQPIDAGGALHAIDEQLAVFSPEFSSHIETIRRQKDEWMRRAVQEAAGGDIAKAIEILDSQGKINIYCRVSDAKRDLVRDFVNHESLSEGKTIVLTHRRSDAHQINSEIRERLKQLGAINEKSIEIHNGTRDIALAEGDRVMLIRNDYDLDVRNGQRGIVVGVDVPARNINIRLDNGQQKNILVDRYNYIEYGWASTTHKAQGVTVEKAYVYGYSQETMASQQASYVQISRAKKETRLYIVNGERSIERKENMGMIESKEKNDLSMEKAGRLRVLEEVKKSWGRDVAKDTTLDYVNKEVRRHSGQIYNLERG